MRHPILRWTAFTLGVALALPALPVWSAPRAQSGAPATAKTELSPLETEVLGQNHWLSGGAASLRVIVSNHQTGRPLPGAEVALTFASVVNGRASAYPIAIYHGVTNSLGTLDASFKAPKMRASPGELTVAVVSSLGKDEVKQAIQLQESSQLMLTADKPLYQPGQVMHLRALALDSATRQAEAGQPITFEIEDARGNKVFKKKDTLSKFGIAATDFQLASEVNMGTFTLRAVLPDGQTEKKVRVDRYVLPKFKVAAGTEKPYYLPGDTVKGTVKANYFFGKPVSGGDVTVTVNTIDIGVTKLADLKGKTDSDGAYKFEYTLPKSFVGQPFEQGKAVVEFAVTLKDTADHKQESHLNVPVVKDPVLIVLVPESPTPVPNIRNRVYIAAATPDGAPLKHLPISIGVVAGIQGNQAAKTATDDLGVATFDFTPGVAACTLRATATSPDGRVTTVERRIEAATRQQGLLLRTDKTLAKVGDKLNVTALCTSKGGTLYLDVIRNKQTMLTQATPMRGGSASLSLPVTADMVGTVEIHAYKILPNEDIIRDTRTLVISPADDLTIQAAADKGQYKPGDDATVRFTVRDAKKHPVLAALGLAIVDESVFALSELQPGLEKIYFTLEKELMEPKYEIHGLKPTNLMEPEPLVSPQVRRDMERQRAAAMLFAAAPKLANFDIHVNTYMVRAEKMRLEALNDMFAAQQKILAALQKYRTETKTSLTAKESLFHLIDLNYLTKSDLMDRWGHFYKTDLNGAANYDGYWTLSCAGPDGRWETNDDIAGISVYGVRNPRGGFRGGGFGGRFRDLQGAAGPEGGAFALGRFEDGLAEDQDRAGMPILLAATRAAAAPGAVNRTVLFKVGSEKSKADAGAGEPAVRVREYFPETMFWNPALITDENGNAEIHVPMADSITTWRMSMTANTASGQLGSGTSPLVVFQDFFVDIDLPVSLTQNDRVEIPVAVYNYLPGAQDVTLTLEEQPWFSLNGPSVQRVHMEKGQVKMVSYPITVKSIGKFPLTVRAKGTKLSDAVRRQIDVLPDGKEFLTTINDRLEGKIDKSVNIPDKAIAGASSIWVKLYPGAFSQVVEGLDGILRMPNGCFEQTSSTTYPNLLVLDYLKQAKHVNPELQMKAEGYINVGYQRLVTFECKAGGFSWFGNEPAHQILTAYGLLEFSDMSKVHEVDPAVIQRTRNWLASKQKPDGTWEEQNQGIAEGIINRQTGALRTTAYIAWALAESGYQDKEKLGSAIGYVKNHLDEAKDPYTLAVILNLLTLVEKDGDSAAKVANDLIALAKTTDKAAWWESDTKTFTGADQKGADLETTGLAAYALAKWGRNSGFTNKVLTYLVQSKDSFGTWQSTQGTVWAMKSLLYASRNASGDGKGTVNVLANGQKIKSFQITPDDNDVMRQVDLKEALKAGDNAITLQYEGEGSLLYQIVGRYYMPWNQVEPPAPEFQPLSLDVSYDKTTLAQDDTATVTVTIHNKTDRIAEMPLIDVGVPPGFTVVPDKLDDAVKDKTISKYTVAARQVIIYLEKLDLGQTVKLTYQIRAKYPIKARTPLSKVYPYYNPEKVAVAAPQDIVVTK